MSSRTPSKLSHYNIWINGDNFLGLCTEINLPKLEVKVEDHKGGGMNVPTPIEMGVESSLEMTMTFSDYNEKVYGAWGVSPLGHIPMTFKGAKRKDGIARPFSVYTRGFLSMIDPGTVQPGGESTLQATAKLSYYRLEDAGKVIIEIDPENLVHIVEGIDHMASVRAAILA